MDNLEITVQVVKELSTVIGIIASCIITIWKLSRDAQKQREEQRRNFEQLQRSIDDLKDRQKIDSENIRNENKQFYEKQAKEIAMTKELSKRVYQMLISFMDCIPEKDSDMYKAFLKAKKETEEFMLKSI